MAFRSSSFLFKANKKHPTQKYLLKKQHLFALQSIKKSNAVLKELGNFSTNSYFHYIPPSSTEKSLVTIRPGLILQFYLKKHTRFSEDTASAA